MAASTLSLGMLTARAFCITRRRWEFEFGSVPPALTAMVMSLPMRANCFAMRFQRANIACFLTSKMRPMERPRQSGGGIVARPGEGLVFLLSAFPGHRGFRCRRSLQQAQQRNGTGFQLDGRRAMQVLVFIARPVLIVRWPGRGVGVGPGLHLFHGRFQPLHRS